MPPKKDPASTVVQFFHDAPLDTAHTVLAICKDIVARRQPARAKASRKPATRAAAHDTTATE